jgi:hypothetical protein
MTQPKHLWHFPRSLMVYLALVLGSGSLCAAEPIKQTITSKDRDFWAFRKLVQSVVPRVQHSPLLRTTIDAFLLAKLKEKGLTYSPGTDRTTLIRRAYFDLLGLPPSPEEVDAFQADPHPDAYERLLDRLLASPHFGERWGRHWLDVVGYVDMSGFDTDATDLRIMPEGKWRYRDYVITAFNQDRPYNQFITEQLAGDELCDWRSAPRFTPQMRELLIATGYLRTARDQTHEPESNIPLCYYGVLHDTVEMIGNSLLGLTLNCAQCHNHKFDPIPQRDYYQLMAMLTPAYNPNAWKPVFPWDPEIKDRALPDVSAKEQQEIARWNAALDQQVAEFTKQRENVLRPHESRLKLAKLHTLPESIRQDTENALQTPVNKRDQVQKYLASKFESLLRVTPDEVLASLSATEKEAVGRLEQRSAACRDRRRSFGKIQALYDVGPPPRTHLLKRGNYTSPGEEVQPGFLSVLCESSQEAVLSESATAGSTSGRRRALARWLTAPDSRATALLARVMVNRIWQHLFGQGIVSTPENFGTGGARPTHPELLEWLSCEFVRNGWRIKPLIKLMMTSTAYRQASRREEGGTAAEAIDPENQLLWRMRLRRLESEVIRDTILAVSGTLDRSQGGPPIMLESRPDGMVVISDKHLSQPSLRWKRSIYLLSRRAYNLSLLSVFDQPLVAVNCTRRDASAVPLQSLTMLNDAFISEQAEHFAQRVSSQADSTDEGAIQFAFRLALGRSPNTVEARFCAQQLHDQIEIYRAAGLRSSQASRKALVQLCHTILNLSEFLYVE